MAAPPTSTQLTNPGFESGVSGWSIDARAGIVNDPANAYAGSWHGVFNGSGAGSDLTNLNVVPSYAGQSITASAYIRSGGATDQVGAFITLLFTDGLGNLTGRFDGNQVLAYPTGDSGWRLSQVTATAPAGTKDVTFAVFQYSSQPSGFSRVDNATWNYQWNRTATITSPIEGGVYTVGSVISFQVALGGTTPAVSSVTYKRGATVIGTSTVAPYTLNTAAIPAGTYAITAEVTNADDTVLITDAVNITVGATPTLREFKASNTYTYLVADKFTGLSSGMPATAIVTGVEIVMDYGIRALIRAKDIGIPDPELANESVAFDITNDAVVEATLMTSDGSSYTAVGGSITEPVTLTRSDFDVVEEGISEGKKWVVLDSSPFTITMGSSTELFGVTPIAASDFAERSLAFKFYPNLLPKPAYADSGDVCFRLLINKLRLRVYFDAGSAEYYFASPDKTQVIKGELVSSSILNGDLETGDASGVLQLTSNLEVMDGTQTWIGDDWTIHAAYPPTDANQIGEVADREADDGVGMSYNGLPSQQQVIANRSRYVFIVANFFADKQLDSIYGAHGLPRAFAYNGNFFYKIYTQPDPIKDSPRHVAYHHGHLALGYDEGRVDISVIGQPYNFDGSLGASSWSIGDKVVGLLPLSGTILGVFGSKSIWGISGTTVDNFATQVISPNIGAIEYTITDMGYPVYANAYGIYTLAQTQQYGDYLGSPMSQDISPWLRPRLIRKLTSDKEVVVAWPVRHKNQYRLAFSDGYVSSMTLNGQQAVPTFSIQKYFITPPDEDPDLGIDLLEYPGMVPVAISSELDDTGEERIHIANFPAIVVPPPEVCVGIDINVVSEPYVLNPADVQFLPSWFTWGDPEFLLALPESIGTIVFEYNGSEDRYETSASIGVIPSGGGTMSSVDEANSICANITTHGGG